MDALTRIPKVLETVEAMRQSLPLEEVFTNYKHNVKLFIQTMKEQVVALITSYENVIFKLQQQISSLTSQTPKRFQRSPPHSLFSPEKCAELDLMQTANSHTLTPFKNSIKLDELPISTIIQKKKSIEESRFNEDLISPQDPLWEQSQSKFEANSRKRRQREEQLRFFLQAGKKNMDVTTNQFLESIGRTRQSAQNREEEQQQVPEDKDNIKREQSLNKSLGQICQSLQTSFVSRRARSEKKKKQVKIMEEQRKKLQVEEETAKMLKDRGIKNLLQRLRDNVESSPQGLKEPITSSKLISVRESKPAGQPSSPGRNKSKVMINPVPVDIGKRSKAGDRDRTPSPERKPQSILKRSSTILSREISTFSINDMTI